VAARGQRMLSYLRVRGLALLDDVTIELGPASWC
jgi:hypothetical protein